MKAREKGGVMTRFEKVMRPILEDLSRTGIRITGSYATGKADVFNSDLDFQLDTDRDDEIECERDCGEDDGRKTQMEMVKEVLAKHKIEWSSDFIGSIFTHNVDDKLPIAMEFAYWYNGEEDRLDRVEVFGVEFDTY